MIDLLKTELAALQKIGTAAVRAESGAALLEQVLNILSSEMAMLRGTFTLRHGDTFCIEVSHGLGEEERRRGIYQLGVGITGTVAKTGTPCLVPDISKDGRFLNLTGARAEGRGISFLCVPVMHREDVIGTLSIDCEKEALPRLQEKLRFLEIVGSLAAEAVAERHRDGEERDALKRENLQLREFISESESLGQLVGNSALIRGVYDDIRQVAPLDAPVLIRGASGTGKELVAAEIHARSARAGKPFVKLNCAALPENLLETELFGYEKGAFAGANSRRQGRLEAAQGGTLFLDEIGEIDLSTQVKLLRFLETHTIERLGSQKQIQLDVRLVCATNRNLSEMVANGTFREDLYYRLSVVALILPPLRERAADIPVLMSHYLKRFAAENALKAPKIAKPAMDILKKYTWPGNIRELRNLCENFVVMHSGSEIGEYDLDPRFALKRVEPPAPPKTPIESVDKNGKPLSEREILKAIKKDRAHQREKIKQARMKTLSKKENEKRLMREALIQARGNRTAAADYLGISRRTFHRKLLEDPSIAAGYVAKRGRRSDADNY